MTAQALSPTPSTLHSGTALPEAALDQLFTSARTHSHFTAQPVPDALLHELYELLKWGPTSANACPMRVKWVRSEAAKAKLLACVSEGNREKTRQAPVTAIIGMDLNFADHLPQLYPHADAKSWFAGNEALTQATAFRNSSLQGAYLILAARALGLSCGPMGGFDAAAMDAAFWAGTQVKTNFICNLGYGDEAKLHPRGPRLPFEQVCELL